MQPLSRNHPTDDPPKDPEIQRYFRALGPPLTGTAPPYLYAQVRARLAREQARPQLFHWFWPVFTPVGTAVLTGVLLLSVGIHIWQGFHMGGPQQAGRRQGVDTAMHDLGGSRRLHTSQFQAGLQHQQPLGTMIAGLATSQAPPIVVGFAPQASRTAFLRIGILFAEALATLQGGTVEATASRLDALARLVAAVQAPPTLGQYLQEMRTLVHTQRYPQETLMAFLAVFEPLYEDAYLRVNRTEEVLLFRTGTWLENMLLAATLPDAVALRQEGQAAKDVRRLFATLQAPPEVVEVLERIQRLVTPQTLGAEDVRTVQALVQRLQALLSE